MVITEQQAIQQGAIKILELSSEDFLLGMALQTKVALGGLFSLANDIDPFEQLGYLLPSLAPADITGSIATTPKFITSVNESGTLYNYIHTASKLYKIAFVGGTQTDITASTGITTGSIQGAIMWRGKYIYATDGSVIALTLGGSTNTTLLTGLSTNPHIMCIGPDNNLYITDGDGVAQITSDTGTSGNTLDVVTFNDTSLSLKDLINDGRYLVLIADSAGVATIGKSRCVVAGWDLAKGSFDFLWDTYETKFIGAKILDDDIIVFGYDNIYKCSRYAKLKKFFSFRGSSTITTRPTAAQSIVVVSSAVYWAGSNKVYAYGSQVEGAKRIFYNPHNTTQGTIECLNHDGISLWAGTSSSVGLYQFNTGSTRSNSLVYTSYIPFSNTYKYAFSKAVLQDKLISGQSIALELGASDGNGIISSSSTKSYDSTNPQKEVIFGYIPLGTDANEAVIFNEVQVKLSLNKIGLQRFELWAYPLGPYGGKRQ